MLRFLPFAILLFLVDLMAFQAVKTVFGTGAMVYGVYWGFSALLFLGFLIAAFVGRQNMPRWAMLYFPPVVMASFFGKLLVDILLLGEDIVRGIQLLVTSDTSPERSAVWSAIALITAGVPFLLLCYGMIRNAYNFEVRHINIGLPNLPQAFKGMRIVQISDIHSGSLTRPEPVKEAVDMINRLDADVIFFTGDLVNLVATEVEPYIPVFSKLKAKHGVYSITGNHDYGDYVAWQSAEQKAANFKLFIDMHKRLGWRLLMNEHERIRVDGEEIAVIGIENWSAKGNFSRYGNLAKAYQGAEDAPVKLLLSHDPSHWKAEVIEQYADIDVMFAGHTHGFQFGFEIGKWKWSPGQYVYREWAGLYQKAHQYLYVNRGFGYTFYPGRVGMLPEISVFTLDQK